MRFSLVSDILTFAGEYMRRLPVMRPFWNSNVTSIGLIRSDISKGPAQSSHGERRSCGTGAGPPPVPLLLP